MLSRNHRVSKNSFQSLQGTGRSFFANTFTTRITLTGTHNPVKVAVIVSKKVSKTAVKRNELRRKVYAAVSPLIKILRPGTILLVYPKQECSDASVKKITETLQSIAKEAKIIL